jgi:hypothetical protein
MYLRRGARKIRLCQPPGISPTKAFIKIPGAVLRYGQLGKAVCGQ